MYKLDIVCNTDCSLQLESLSEIKIKNNRNAIVSTETSGLTPKEVKEVIDIIEEIHIKGVPRVEQLMKKQENLNEQMLNDLKKENERIRRKDIIQKKVVIDTCKNIKGYKYKANSCYLDSVIFSLFAFPSDFIKTYIIDVTREELQRRMLQNIMPNKTRLHEYKKLSTEQRDVIINYIMNIKQIILKIIGSIHGSTSTPSSDLVDELRNTLLYDPIYAINDSSIKPFRVLKGTQEDTDDFLVCLLGTFIIENLIKKEVSVYSFNEKEVERTEGFPEKELPIIRINPNDYTHVNDSIFKNIHKENLDVDEEKIVGEKKFKNLRHAEILQRTKKILYINHIYATLLAELKNPKSVFSNSEKGMILKGIQELKIKYSYLELFFKVDIMKKAISDLIEFIGLLKSNIPDDSENELLKDLTELMNKTLSKDTPKILKIYNVFKQYKNNSSSGYNILHQQYLNELTTLYANKKEIYLELKLNQHNLQDHYLIVTITRFTSQGSKTQTLVEFQQSLKLPSSDTLLTLNSIIIHQGSTISSGHYQVAFRCNDKWYLYDNIVPTIQRIGSFDDLLSYKNKEIQHNATQLFYNTVLPRVI